MCGYDPFWIYDSMLEQEYLERMEAEEKEFEKDLRNKTNDELEQLLRDAEELQNGDLRKKVIQEKNRRHE